LELNVQHGEWRRELNEENRRCVRRRKQEKIIALHAAPRRALICKGDVEAMFDMQVMWIVWPGCEAIVG
jgi:hypothetical protein